MVGIVFVAMQNHYNLIYREEARRDESNCASTEAWR
jgi:hypothetical protein